MPAKNPIPAWLRQSRNGRARVKVGAPTGKVHGRVNLNEYTSLSASSKKGSIPAYSLMICSKVPAKSHTHKLPPTTVLLDTGASVSLMPLWQAKAFFIKGKSHTDIVIRGAYGKPLAVVDLRHIWVPESVTPSPPIGRRSRWL